MTTAVAAAAVAVAALVVTRASAARWAREVTLCDRSSRATTGQSGTDRPLRPAVLAQPPATVFLRQGAALCAGDSARRVVGRRRSL